MPCTTLAAKAIPPPPVCTPLLQCELDPSGKRTGYLIDGCGYREYKGNRFESCELPLPPCVPSWTCLKDSSGNNTGHKSDGCGNTQYDPIACPLPPPVISVVINAVSWYDRPDGSPGIRIDFTATANRACAFKYSTKVDGVLIGYEQITSMPSGSKPFYSVAWSESDPFASHTVCIDVVGTGESGVML